MEIVFKECSMRRSMKVFLLLSLFSASVSVFADGYDYAKEDLAGYVPDDGVISNGPQHSDEMNYARNGRSVYFFGGYVYAHQFWKSSSQTLVTGGGSLTYNPNNIFPNGFNAFQLGIGKELTRYLDMQFAYLQYLQSSKSSTIQGFNASTEVKSSGVLGALNIVFNPDSAFQVSAKLGAVVQENDDTVSVAGSSYYTLNNSTRVQPAIGMDFLWNFVPSFGMRFGLLYIADVEGNYSNGNALGMVSLNYTMT